MPYYYTDLILNKVSALGLAVQFLAGPGRRKLGQVGLWVPHDRPQRLDREPPPAASHSTHAQSPQVPIPRGLRAVGGSGPHAQPGPREQEGEETASAVTGAAMTGLCVSSERMSCDWNS